MLPVGKLPAAALETVLARLTTQDPRLLIGPKPGEDAAVVDLGDCCLVFATDPVTFATDRIGWYAVQVNANDVAVLGARPQWFLATVLLPEAASTVELADSIVHEMAAACAELGATLCGGHTEITAGLDRPVVVGTMIGETSRERLVRKQRFGPGDEVLLAGAIAIEGTALLAREHRGRLQQAADDELLDRAGRLLFDPGISVVRAAMTAIDAGTVHALHDPTEGGLAGGLLELAVAAGAGLHVFGDRIPVLAETRILCEALGLDPLRLIASGALLVGAPAPEIPRIAAALRQVRIPVTTIAEARDPAHGVTIEWQGRVSRLVPPDRDEIARIARA